MDLWGQRQVETQNRLMFEEGEFPVITKSLGGLCLVRAVLTEKMLGKEEVS